MRRLHIALLAAATLALIACDSEHTPDPADTIAIEQPATNLTDHTRDTFQLTWAITGEPERDMYCASVALLGADAAADEMRAGAGYDDSLDWTVMAELLEAECAAR